MFLLVVMLFFFFFSFFLMTFSFFSSFSYIRNTHQNVFKAVILNFRMDIIEARAEARRNKISVIAATIKKAFSASVDIDKDNLVHEICFQTGVSRRTSLEYLDIALVSFNTEEIKIDGRVMIAEKK